MSEQDLYYQGEYAGPLTQRAMNYDGHPVIGIQISDAAPDGTCLFVTIDQHMMISVAPVMASSIAPYEPAEPPPDPVCTPEEIADTRKNLEWLLKLQLEHGISCIGDLRACALTMSDLADVIEIQERAQAAQAPGQALDASSSADVPSAERSADAKRGSRANWPRIRQYVSGQALKSEAQS